MIKLKNKNRRINVIASDLIKLKQKLKLKARYA